MDNKVVTKPELEEAVKKYKEGNAIKRDILKSLEGRRKLLEAVLEKPTTITNRNGYVMDLYYLTDKELEAFQEVGV